MNITVITTFGPRQYEEYAKRMIDTFAEYWDESIKLVFYTDEYIPPLPESVEVRQFPAWFAPWRERHGNSEDAHGCDQARNRAKRTYDFRRDCVRFSFKVAALTDLTLQPDLLIWMDADIITFKPVDVQWLLEAVRPRPTWMSWLDRKRLYPECGFMAFDCNNPVTTEFRTALLDIYESDRVFSLAETHDSYVIQQVVNIGSWRAPRSLNNSAGISLHHPFPVIELGKRLDHLKGRRKIMPKSPERI
jgi:hypothetical protein